MSGRARSSGLLLEGTTTVSDTANTLSGVIVFNEGAADATITVYDHASEPSGTILAKLIAAVGTGSNSLALATPIRAENGLTVVVAGTNKPRGIILYGA